MISQDDLFKIVGAAVILIVGAGILLKMFSYQKKVVEGLTANSKTDKTKISSDVSGSADKLSDSLLISKYRSSYEDTVINLEKAVSLAMVSEVINNSEAIAKDPTSPESTSIIQKINGLKDLRETLNKSILILDKN
jgi:hypothetical protein